MNLEAVMSWSKTVAQDYTAKDTALYALAIGAVSDPLDTSQLRLVDENEQVLVPSMASVLASPGFWARDEHALEINFAKLVHGEQRIEIEKTLPAQGRIIGISRVTRVIDKGADKGALITVCKTLQSENGDRYGRAWQSFFCRGDGGFSTTGKNDLILDEEPLSTLPEAPSRQPDRCVSMPIHSDAALLYRLCGDLNRLHIDPKFAQQAGFTHPILHGLATYGRASIAAIRTFASGKAEKLVAMDARFSSPLFPGETVDFRMWDEGTYIAIEGIVQARDTVVISHARARFQ